MSNNIYDILKKIAGLEQAKTTLTEGKKAKPDYIDVDKDGDKKEPLKKAAKDKEKGAIAEAVAMVESALMEKYMGFKKVAAAGKKLGEDQFDENFSKDETDAAVRDFMSRGGRAQQLPMKKPRKSEKTEFGSHHLGTIGGKATSKGKLTGKGANVNPKGGKPVVTAEDGMGEGNEFSRALARARAQGKDSFEVGGKTYKVDEAKHFRTSYGWAGGRNEKTGKTYKHPDQIKADREAKKAEKEKQEKKSVTESYVGRETKDGVWRVFKTGHAVAVAGPFKSAEEARAWIKKQEKGVKEGWDDMQAYLKKKNKDSDSKGSGGVKAGKRYGGAAQHDDDNDTDTKAADTLKTRGRPKKDKFAR